LVLTLHSLRESCKKDRAAIINTIRGLFTAYGIVFPQGPDELRLRLTDALEDASHELTPPARRVLQRAHPQWLELELHQAWCDELGVPLERFARHRCSGPRGRAVG
jgi:transposase